MNKKLYQLHELFHKHEFTDTNVYIGEFSLQVCCCGCFREKSIHNEQCLAYSKYSRRWQVTTIRETAYCITGTRLLADYKAYALQVFGIKCTPPLNKDTAEKLRVDGLNRKEANECK